MQNDYYVLAHEQAGRERAELRAQIAKLLLRDEKLEKLLTCLKEFLPIAESTPTEHSHEAVAHEHHGENHEHAHQGA